MSGSSLEGLLGISAKSLGLSSRSRSRSNSRSKSPQPPNHSHQTLTIRPSPMGQESFIIDRASMDGSILPLFCFTKTKKGSQIYRIGAWDSSIPQTFISETTYSSMSGHTTFDLHGESVKVKTSSSGSGAKFSNSMGDFRWKSDSIGKQALALMDGSGMTLARYQIDQRLDILVPCDDLFLDVVVVSALAAAKLKKKSSEAIEAAAEVIGGLGG